ncbi:unnamed protein product [Thelazia callipaeda]|uniref:Coiled-coil domain-containing protein 176 n=1 Tax=Thelazia callipaeda TaxID=103827 RepID=A0A0N5D374_THECL|nr:unnamed protein product [Thelazia callipaeda]
MGDLVHDALRATGFSEEVEALIADIIVQRLDQDPSWIVVSQQTDNKKFGNKELNLARVRIIAEQLWRRVERIYDNKFQVWKQNEEKSINDMVTKLRHVYKKNLLLKQRQFEELIERKDQEYKDKENLLREDVRLIYEKKKLELEKAWRFIETAQKELQIRKELLENAQACFNTRKENELYHIEHEKRSLKQVKRTLDMQEKNFNQRVQEAIQKAREKDNAQMKGMISEWNEKEAILSKKYAIVWNKICEISTEQQVSAQEFTRLKKIEEEMLIYYKKLAETERALSEATETQHRISGDLDCIRNEKTMLYQEMERMQMVSLELQKQRQEDFSPSRVPPAVARNTALDLISISSSTPTETSFDRDVLKKMKILNIAKQELDSSLENIRLRGHLRPVEYMKCKKISCDHINDMENRGSLTHIIENEHLITASGIAQDVKIEDRISLKDLVGSRSTLRKNDGEYTSNPAVHSVEKTEGKNVTCCVEKDSKIDLHMLQYMKMVQDETKETIVLTPEAGYGESDEVSFAVETSQKLGASTDFSW